MKVMLLCFVSIPALWVCTYANLHPVYCFIAGQAIGAMGAVVIIYNR